MAIKIASFEKFCHPNNLQIAVNVILKRGNVISMLWVACCIFGSEKKS